MKNPAPRGGVSKSQGLSNAASCGELDPKRLNTKASVTLLPSRTRAVTKIAFHSYDAEFIALWCNIVLSCSVSMRAASRVSSLFLMFFGCDLSKSASWLTGRLWLMRLGYYKLNRPKDKAGKWIWILDHSVQIGPEKCLLILGVQHNKLPKNRPLNYSDVEPIELFPVTKSNGDIVYKQLEETIKKTGVPSSIVADHGGDIKSGIDKFCKQNNETIYIHDVKHKMALLLKKFLNKDERWNDFTRQANSSKAQMQQTELAPLSPPAQRSKARYMNIEHLLNWAEEVLLLLDEPECLKQNDINPNIAED